MTIQVLTCLVHNNITYYLSWVIVNRNIALTVLKKVNFKFFPYVNQFITGQHKSVFAKANNIGSSSKYVGASVFFLRKSECRYLKDFRCKMKTTTLPYYHESVI